MDWDVGNVFTSDQQLRALDVQVAHEFVGALTAATAHQRFQEFIRTFRIKGCFPYREKLLQNYRKKCHFVEINLRDLNSYDPELLNTLQKYPNKILRRDK